MSDTSDRDVSKADRKGAPDARRRRFLMAFGVSAAGAASASALATAPALAVEPAQDTPDAQGYRETEHVRNYYATTRI